MNYGKYFQKVHTKLSIRDRMKLKRTFGVIPGCIPDPKKGYKRFERWLKVPRKAVELYWRVRGVKTWQDMQKGLYATRYATGGIYPDIPKQLIGEQP